MTAVVVMAYRDLGCAYRRRAFEYVRQFHRNLGYGDMLAPVVIVDCPDPFTKARALNHAIRELDPGTIIVQVDPDSFLPGGTFVYEDAIREAAVSPGLVIPHTRYLYLCDPSTRLLFNGGLEIGELGPTDCDSFGHAGVGNVTVFSRETWEQAGGYDERFPLWGGDDAAFAYACGGLVAPQRRLPGDVIHLWHPRHPDSQVGSRGYDAQAAILDQYRDAEAIGPEAIRELVENR